MSQSVVEKDTSSMTVRIVLLEDDSLISQWISEKLPEDDVIVTQLGTEADFQEWVKNANASVPYIFILDLRVRWTRPAPAMTMPPATCTDPTLAGVRCLEQIMEKQFSRQEIIIFSIHAGEQWREKNPEAARVIDNSGAVHLWKTDGLDPLMDAYEKAAKRQRDRMTP